MKAMLAVFACSFAAALAIGATTPAPKHASPVVTGAPADESIHCPPDQIECCDGLVTTHGSCADHGGPCNIVSICGTSV